MTTALATKPDVTADALEPEVVNLPKAELAKIAPAVTDALVLQRDPTEVLAEATKAAKALMAVMAQKKDKIMMGGEQYIENEDWLTIGHFYGVTAQIESDHYVEFGTVKGWEATAVLVARDGRVLGRATAMCLNDEDKWSARPKKEWAYCHGPEEDHAKHEHSVAEPPKLVWVPNPNKPGKNVPRKMQIVTGTVAVPFFQLRSMAQTRASSKVHSSVLRFVPVLAGFKGTPAEELPDATREDNAPRTPTEPVAPLPAATKESHQNPIGPNGGESGTLLAQEDDTVLLSPPRTAPAGYHFITFFGMDGDWHQFDVLRWDAQGGALRVSTKFADVADKAKMAAIEGIPVQAKITMKKGSHNGGYLNSVTLWEPPKDEPLTAESIPF